MKLLKILPVFVDKSSYYPLSIITRIETIISNACCIVMLLLLSPFHYNKDWNIYYLNTKNLKIQGYYPLSIITRIETFDIVVYYVVIVLLLSPFHYNKDWNTEGRFVWRTISGLLSPFHYNKDWNWHIVHLCTSLQLAIIPFPL